MRKYVQELDSAWAEAQEDPLCLVVAADASVPSNSKFQATAAAVLYTPPPRPSGLRSDAQTPRTVLGLSELSERTPRTVRVSEQSPRTVRSDYTQTKNKIK
jgi:hypothetical protein